MTPPDVLLLLADAEVAARRGGDVLRERFSSPRTIAFKGGIDLVTDADRASEQVILDLLRARHPTARLLGEESGTSGEGGELRWIVDPLDGTTNYAHQVPHFCVSVAVEGRAGLLAGAIYDPVRDELFSAAAGHPTRLNGQPVSVSTTGDLERALLCTGFPYDVRKNPTAPLGLFNRFIRRAQGVRRMGSAALDLAYVAAGRFDGYFEFGLKAWDVAAGALLVQQAGGFATSIRGGPLDLHGGNILASNAALNDVLQTECLAFLEETGSRL